MQSLKSYALLGINRYSGWLVKYPLVTRAATTSFIFVTGDVLAQSLFNKGMPYDWKRSMRTATLGFFVTGPSLYAWFNLVLPRIVGLPILASLSNTQRAVVGTIIDQSVFAWWTISNYLFWVNFLQHRDFRLAVENVKWNILPSILAAWTYWPLIIFGNLSLVPMAYRVFFVNIGSIFWNLYLSWRNQKGLEQRGLAKPNTPIMASEPVLPSGEQL